jgi:midasin (ATPase involved in ribosome maturation)
MRKEHFKNEEEKLGRCQILYPYCQKVVRVLWGLAGNRKEKRSLRHQNTFHKFEKL